MAERKLLSDVGGLAGNGEPILKTACTVALGFAIGMFPLLGVTTVICVLIARVAGCVRRLSN